MKVTTVKRLLCWAPVALSIGCSTTPNDLAIQANKAQSPAEKAELYLKAADLASKEEISDSEGFYLHQAAEELLRVPGGLDAAVRHLTRSREVYRKPTKRTVMSPDERTAYMAFTSAKLAEALATTDPIQAQSHLDKVVAGCTDGAAAQMACNWATSYATRAATRLGGGKAKFNIALAALRQPAASREPSQYDSLIRQANELGLSQEASEIAKAKDALLAVEGSSPGKNYYSTEPAQLRVSIGELTRFAQRYTQLGFRWLADIRNAEAEQLNSLLGQVVAQAQLVDEIQARRQASREQALEVLTRVVEARAGGRAAAAAAPTSSDGSLSLPARGNCIQASIGPNDSGGIGNSALTLTNTCREELNVYVEWKFQDGFTDDTPLIPPIAGGSSYVLRGRVSSRRGAIVSRVGACPSPRSASITFGRPVEGGQPRLNNAGCNYSPKPEEAGVSR